MKVVNSKEMALIDRVTIDSYGISSLVLMERAALSVCKHILNLSPKTVTILVGPGNNGGDGVAVGRILKGKYDDIKIFQLFPHEKLSEDCKIQLEIAKKFGVTVIERFPSLEELKKGDLIVDALFGTGLKREIEGELKELISNLNSLNKRVIAVDIPSGVSSDNGQILGEAVRASVTVTFGLPKRGHFLYPGKDYVGELYIEDIGFPKELAESEDIKVSLITRELASVLLPKRHPYSHKGTYGHVLVIAGSVGKTGAALMCAKSSLRAGSGLVTMAVPAALKVVFLSRVLEEMILPLPCNTKTLSKDAMPQIFDFIKTHADVVAFGPGVGINQDTREILKGLLLESQVPVVIDADGITLLSDNELKEILKQSQTKTVLTPHPGELSRLIGVPVKDIDSNRIEIAQNVARELKTVLVLKGVPTVVASPTEEAFINTTGNPGMATGGSGDVLTGIIASFIGQGLNPLEASILGVFVHGLAGDRASDLRGYHGLIAGDIIESIPATLKELYDEENNKS